MAKKRRNKHLEAETKPKKDPFAIPLIHFDLGEGYYFAMEERNNGVGGYATVAIGMYKGEELIRLISDRTGYFLEFPGVEHGEWEDELRFPFEEAVRFTVRFRKFGEDGLAKVFWTVQPDGRYWADDGFGMEDDMEIVLLALLAVLIVLLHAIGHGEQPVDKIGVWIRYSFAVLVCLSFISQMFVPAYRLIMPLMGDGVCMIALLVVYIVLPKSRTADNSCLERQRN